MTSNIYPKQYQALALRTLCSMDSALSRFGEGKNVQFLHSVIGLTSELSELVEVVRHFKTEEVWHTPSSMGNLSPAAIQIAGEGGDVMWYCAELLDSFGLTFEEVPHHLSSLSTVSETTVLEVVGGFASLAQKKIYYGKPLSQTGVNQQILSGVGKILSYVRLVTLPYGLSLATIASMNLSKLAVRYPDKYTDREAHVRDNAKEQAALESTAALISASEKLIQTPAGSGSVENPG